MKAKFSGILVCALLGIGAVHGQNLLTNGDFETPATTPSPIPGWTLSGTAEIKEEMEGATSGNFGAAFNIGHDSQGSVLSQSFATIAGHTYLLSFDSGIFGAPTGTLSLQVMVIGSSNQILVSRTVIPPVANTTTPSAVVFRHYQNTFVANGSTTVLQFTDQGTGNLDADTILDTVSVIEIPTQPNLLTNGDFETAPFNMTGMVTGWTVGGTGFVSDQDGEGATTGTHSAALDVAGDSIGNTLSQTFNTTAGTVYVLDFDAGIFGEPSGNPLQVRVQVTGPGSLLDQTVNPPVTGLGLTDFQHYSFTFTAAAAMTTLQFTDQGGSNGSADVVVDTVTVAASAAPTATPTNTPTATPTSTPTATPSTTPTASPDPTPTATPPKPTPTPKPTKPTPTPKPSPSVSNAIAFRISVAPGKINEGGAATFTISMSRTSPNPTVVNYIVSGNAVLGQDYTLSGTTGQVTIPAGQISATVTLTALNDNMAENNEMVTLTLSGPTRGKKSASVMIEKQKTHGRGPH